MTLTADDKRGRIAARVLAVPPMPELDECERCERAFPAAGDGWNGLCGDCADIDEERAVPTCTTCGLPLDSAHFDAD